MKKKAGRRGETVEKGGKKRFTITKAFERWGVRWRQEKKGKPSRYTNSTRGRLLKTDWLCKPHTNFSRCIPARWVETEYYHEWKKTISQRGKSQVTKYMISGRHQGRDR